MSKIEPVVLRLRRVGNSLGLILPKSLVDAKGLSPDDPVQVELDRAPSLAEVVGRLRKYHLTPKQWNDSVDAGAPA